MNAGCREKDLAHIGKHLDKFTVRGLLHGKHTALLPTSTHPAQTISQSVFLASSEESDATCGRSWALCQPESIIIAIMQRH